MNDVISILSVVGDSDWIATEDGLPVYNRIKQLLNDGQEAYVSFAGYTSAYTPFLNAAIGQAYRDFPVEFVDSHLHLLDLDEYLRLKMPIVKTASVQYYNAQKEMQAKSEAELNKEFAS